MANDAIPTSDAGLARSGGEAKLVYLRGPPAEDTDPEVTGPLASLGNEEWKRLCEDVERWLATGAL